MFFTRKQTDGKVYDREGIDLIDMHSHVLPAIDDGSESVERSLEMLRFSCDRGVRKIVATPHFYPHSMNPLDFLERRERAVKAIAAAATDARSSGEELPEVYIGAEVAYFDGISRSEAVSRLGILGTKLLLVEMPFSRWSEGCINELIALKAKGFVPVVAHYDRYWSYQRNGVLERLLEHGVIIQLNAEAFLRFTTKRTALALVSAGAVGFLGSDCHNMEDRKPNLADAAEVICRSAGVDCVKQIMDGAAALLENAEAIF